MLLLVPPAGAWISVDEAAAPCPPRAPMVQVSVVDPEPPRISRTFTIQGIREETGQPASGGPNHLGVTISRFEVRSELQTSFAYDWAGICAVPAKVTVRLVHADHRILIAQEIPEGGCLDAEVAAHERRHAAVNRRLLRDAAAAVRRALEAWAARAAARAQTVEVASAKLRDEMGRTLKPALAAVDRARQAEQRTIDTPQEYRRLAQACPEEHARLLEMLRAE